MAIPTESLTLLLARSCTGNEIRQGRSRLSPGNWPGPKLFSRRVRCTILVRQTVYKPPRQYKQSHCNPRDRSTIGRSSMTSHNGSSGVSLDVASRLRSRLPACGKRPLEPAALLPALARHENELVGTLGARVIRRRLFHASSSHQSIQPDETLIH